MNSLGSNILYILPAESCSLTDPARVKRAQRHGGYLGGRAFAAQVVAGALDGEEFVRSGNEFQSFVHLVDGAEGIASAVHKECRSRELREVSGAQIGGAAWGMQRVGKQQQAGGELGPIRRQQGR